MPSQGANLKDVFLRLGICRKFLKGGSHLHLSLAHEKTLDTHQKYNKNISRNIAIGTSIANKHYHKHKHKHEHKHRHGAQEEYNIMYIVHSI